jgi:alpha-tubulin suppressor-like RCC1 family protein
LTLENELYAFGAGNYGECGYGEFLDTAKPKLVKFPTKGSGKGHDETSNFGGGSEALDMYVRETLII